MVAVKSISNIFPRPAGKHVNQVNQVNQVRCAKEFSNCLRLLVTVPWTGRKRVSLAARGAPQLLALWPGRNSPCGDGGTWQM